MAITLNARKHELKKRFALPHEWGQHQNDEEKRETVADLLWGVK